MSRRGGRGRRSEPRCYSRVDDEVSLSTGYLGEAVERFVKDLDGMAAGALRESLEELSEPVARVLLTIWFFEQCCQYNGCEEGRLMAEQIGADWTDEKRQEYLTRISMHLRQCTKSRGEVPGAVQELLTSPAFVRRLGARLAEVSYTPSWLPGWIAEIESATVDLPRSVRTDALRTER